MFAPALARCSRLANKQTCDFGLPKSVFFRHFFVERQRNGIKPYTERAKLGEAQGVVADNLAIAPFIARTQYKPHEENQKMVFLHF